MARKNSSGLLAKYINPGYYLRRPRRLGFLCLFFILIMCVIIDHVNQAQQLDGLRFKVQSLELEKRGIYEKLRLIQSASSELSEAVKSEGTIRQRHKDGTLLLGVGDDRGDDRLSDSNQIVGREVNPINPIVKESGHESVAEAKAVNNKEAEAPLDPKTRKRQDAVKEAMVHAWKAYETYAWGFDELQPQSRRGTNTFGSLGATVVDSLDTLFIMGLEEQFNHAKEWIASSLDFNKHYTASTFETTIRVLGGLIAAYDLSGDSVFLDKAVDLADRLSQAFETPTGIPYNRINLAGGGGHNEGWTGGGSTLSEFGTEQLEFIGLSQRTGNPKYAQKVEKVIRQVRESAFPPDGLVPIYVSPHSGRAVNSKIQLGAMGDSFYEYLLKVWVQGGKTSTVTMYREMWEQSMEGMMSGLVQRVQPSNFTYIAERNSGSLIHKMDHLACFIPGMLALGYRTMPNHPKAAEYLQLAKELTRTCYAFYERMPSKLSGENYHFMSGQDFAVGQGYNILRPETVESLFYMWRITKDPIYREWGWNIFEAFQKQCRVEAGYTGLQDVSSNPAPKDDMMQSFFLAETLKYLYLLFSTDSTMSLDEWVFNTEAHPIRIIPRPDASFPAPTPPTADFAAQGDRAGVEVDRRKVGRKEGLGGGIR
eukprot:TRINITY_DN916_c0_g1_i1.p1 TRINITY_DN916_c0_g1~~TRINITY_DN916_c0_g1_i1.p1  ORF type:complete len:650 (-),score=125.40 TRINITY_DN916_c0_g1_i1:823-2772(-)